METASDEVVHPAEGHRIEGLHRQLELAAAEKELEHGRRRKFRRATEAAPLWIELLPQAAHCIGEQRGHHRFARRLDASAQALHDRSGVRLDFAPPFAPAVPAPFRTLLEVRQSGPSLE